MTLPFGYAFSSIVFFPSQQWQKIFTFLLNSPHLFSLAVFWRSAPANLVAGDHVET
jgi:hypothetical protein